MKAAVVEKPGVLTVREVPKPRPGPYDALCELLYGATCTGTDLHLIDAVFPWPPAYPAILGHESVGRVVETGTKVENFKPGDLISRVGAPRLPEAGLDVCWGGFAGFGIARDHWAMQKAGLPAQEWAPYRVNQVIPPGIDPRAATMIITWRETFSYINRMGVGKGSSLLVAGSGGNGLAFIAHAANLGAEPLVMLGSASRKEAAYRAGASHFVDFRQPGWLEQLCEICPAGFDAVIDALGRKEIVQQSLGQVRRGGTFGIYGVDDFGQAMIDPFKARGPFRWNPNEYDEAEAHGAIVDFILSGRLDASIWMDLDHPYPLERIGEAYAALRRKEHIKALIKISG
jgi:D-arabinose 1-dehydrogenase-like Zn-dependent alcohol dehydrogenase